METAIISAIASIIVSIMTLVGVIITTKSNHDKTIFEVQKQTALMEQKYDMVTADIKRDIQALEKKQDTHNGIIERMYSVEKRMELAEERQKTANHRIDDLEKKG